jgi:hypothetical protein
MIGCGPEAARGLADDLDGRAACNDRARGRPPGAEPLSDHSGVVRSGARVRHSLRRL